MRTKQNDMKNATPFTDSMIAKYEEQVAVLSPNEFGKYPYTKEALEVAIEQLEMWKATKYRAETTPITGICGISARSWRIHSGNEFAS